MEFGLRIRNAESISEFALWWSVFGELDVFFVFFDELVDLIESAPGNGNAAEVDVLLGGFGWGSLGSVGFVALEDLAKDGEVLFERGDFGLEAAKRGARSCGSKSLGQFVCQSVSNFLEGFGENGKLGDDAPDRV